jgi:hypothetical protein
MEDRGLGLQLSRSKFSKKQQVSREFTPIKNIKIIANDIARK